MPGVNSLGPRAHLYTVNGVMLCRGRFVPVGSKEVEVAYSYMSHQHQDHQSR
jgi:hypothetical protein